MRLRNRQISSISLTNKFWMKQTQQLSITSLQLTGIFLLDLAQISMALLFGNCKKKLEITISNVHKRFQFQRQTQRHVFSHWSPYISHLGQHVLFCGQTIIWADHIIIYSWPITSNGQELILYQREKYVTFVKNSFIRFDSEDSIFYKSI